MSISDMTLVVLMLLPFICGFITLIVLQKRYVKFNIRVLLAVIIGLAVGVITKYLLMDKLIEDEVAFSLSKDWINLIGRGYVNLLRLLIVPIVFVSITSAVVGLGKSKGVKKIVGWILGVLLFTTAISAIIGIGSAKVFNLDASNFEMGEKEAERAGTLEGLNEEKVSTPNRLLSMVPKNIFRDFSEDNDSSILGVVIFSSILGFAVLGVQKKDEEKAMPFVKFLESLNAIVLRMTTLILRLTPYGVMALLARTVMITDIEAIKELGIFVVASYVGLALIFVVHLILIGIFGISPAKYIKKVWPVLVFAFSSRSSAATIPFNSETQHKVLGVQEGVANTSASLGATIGQNGCAGLYPAMLAVMIAVATPSVAFNFGFIVELILIITITSFGVAGVGGGATFAAIIVLSSMNLPVGLAAVLISIEPLIDMGRTAINVSGSMTAGIICAKKTGNFDESVFNSDVTVDVEA